MNKQVTIFIWKKTYFLSFTSNLAKFKWKDFSNAYFSCFRWKYCSVSQNVIFMSVIYLHFSNCKFLIFCSMDWFRYQKPIAIDQFRNPRFLGQKFGMVPWISIYLILHTTLIIAVRSGKLGIYTLQTPPWSILKVCPSWRFLATSC